MTIDASKYRKLKKSGLLNGTIKAAVAKATARFGLHFPVIVDPLEFPMRDRIEESKKLISTGDGTAIRSIVKRVRDEHPRLRNWTGSLPSKNHTKMRKNDLGSYSSKCKYTQYTYEFLVQSYGVAVGKALWFHLDGSKVRIPAPRGYRWESDEYGIKLVSKSDKRGEYHPTATQLLELKPKEIVSLLKSNLKSRLALAKKSKQQASVVKRAEREGATVCLADSIRAGNCRAGSESFARNNNLDPRRHYRPSEILAITKGDTSRVAIVVAVALRRHRAEMDRGYAILDEHRIA